WEASAGIGRKGWRTLSGGQWRDWWRGVEDTEWRVSGGQWRDWQRGMVDTGWRSVEGLAEGVEDTEWRSVEGLALRDGGHWVEVSGGIGRGGGH
ncbi:unnamed protein product, partial [Staurois parvus]